VGGAELMRRTNGVAAVNIIANTKIYAQNNYVEESHDHMHMGL
jgi:hypothetical protein